MKKQILNLIITIISVSLFCSGAYASSAITEVSSFKQLKDLVITTPPAETLLVMDDDDTLTMMSCPDKKKDACSCQYLGGPAWYSWQSSLLETSSPFKVANTEDTLLEIAALLLSINNMVYTEKDLPNILSSLADSGVRLLVETARGKSNLNATENQFSGLPAGKTGKGSFLALIRDHSLNFGKGEMPSKAGPYYPCNITKSRQIMYQQGVMYLAGQNKGTMLQCLLKNYEDENSYVDANTTTVTTTDNGKTITTTTTKNKRCSNAKPIKYIFFIDDTFDNVKDVHKAFENGQRYQVTAIHYTRLEDHKKALTHGPNAKDYQNCAKKRWGKIRSTLRNELRDPAIPSSP